MKSMVKTKQMLAMLVFVTLIFLGCKKEDPKPLPPVVKAVLVSASAAPSAVAYGGASKISATAQNGTTLIFSLNGTPVKTVAAATAELEVSDLLTTTTYQVVAKNSLGAESIPVNVTVTVAPVDPKLKLLLEGKWQLVKEERMRKWDGETSYSEVPINPCEADDVYSFPTPTTCIAVWGPCSSAPDVEALTNKVYFEGYNPVTGILLWHGSADPYTVLAISETTLRIHKQISVLDDFSKKTDLIKEYKNVK